jgi:hypothetical protein
MQLQSCRTKYSASATRLPSFNQLSQLRHLRSQKPLFQTPKSSTDRHTSLIHSFRQSRQSYRSTAQQLETLLPSSTMSTSILSRMFKLWFFLSCLKPTRHPTTTTQSSTSLRAFIIIQTRCRRQRTSYTLSSRALTLFTHI